MQPPYPRGVRVRCGSAAVEADLDQRRVQPYGQRGDLRRHVLGASAGGGVAAAGERGDDLLDEPDLAVGGGLEGAQVTRLEAEVGELARGLGDDQRVAV